MSWKQLLAQRKVQFHRTSNEELEQLRALVDRDLNDAALTAIAGSLQRTMLHFRPRKWLLLVLGTA